ncbi:MAG TPA: ribonuclease HII [Candidatus Paceibacterota bacterium]|nr:ribonuclease HII [Candidatus Paceibacterota bacterium]
MENRYIVGIDEVGRGPIAGPVAVCAFLVKDSSFSTTPTDKKLPKLKDSKKLTKRQRVTWFNYLKDKKEEGLCDFSVTFVSSENIDKFGINKCIQKALNESLGKITTQNILFARSSDEGGQGARPSQKEHFASFSVFLDGGLHAPKEYVNQETIIKGDELHPVISCASIIAKVSRDRVMLSYAKKYPEYGFDSHVGYGTKSHYTAVKKYGQTPIHRKSFIH